MRLFLGAFASCTDEAITTKAACVGLDDSGEPLEWRNPWVGSFDSYGDSMVTLFQAMTGDTLPDILFIGMDSVGIDVAPVRTDWSFSGLFFIAWLLVGTFMALNLFVGAIVENFSRLSKEADGSALMSRDQAQWARLHKLMRGLKAARQAPAPTWFTTLRKPVYTYILSASFSNTMLAFVIINVNVLAADYHHIEHDLQFYHAWHTCAKFFYYLYWGEFLLKITGLGPAGYFMSEERWFEFFLLLSSIFEEIATHSGMELNPMVMRVLRVSRALRILRLLSSSADVRQLLNTVLESGPAIANVASVLALVMFIYAVLGMMLFTWVMRNDGLNAHANFETFGGALLLLFQVLTGDSWSGVMWGAMVDEDLGCDPHATPVSNCGTVLAMPYFVSFILIGSFVFLNLVVAIVLENFGTMSAERDEQIRRQESGETELVTADHIEEFTALWALFDSNGDEQIPRSRLPYIVACLREPLGLKRASDSRATIDIIEAAEAAAIVKATGEDQSTWLPAVPADELAKAMAICNHLQLRQSSRRSSFNANTTEIDPAQDDPQIDLGHTLEKLMERAFKEVLGIQI